MNNRIKCTTTQEALQAIADDDIPEIYGDVVIRIRTPCTVVVKEGMPCLLIFGRISPTILVEGDSTPVIRPQPCSSPIISTRDSSRAFITAEEYSEPHIHTYDSSSPKINMWHTGAATINTHDLSAPTIYTHGPNKTTINTQDQSKPSIRVGTKSNPTIRTCDASFPFILNYSASAPTIIARDHSTPFIEPINANSATIDAHDSSRVTFKWLKHSIFAGFSALTCDETASIRVLGPNEHNPSWPTLSPSATPRDWVNFFELPIVDEEYVYLYKALYEGFCAKHKAFKYLPGTTVEAPDWDPIPECGHGLHFSPTPHMALQFNDAAKKFTACRVKISEIVVHPDGKFPEKAKAPRVYEIVEVDIHGNRITPA